MNAETNPFSPGAGAPPPELVGRDGILDQARVLLARIRARRPAKSLLLVGLRGVGKTVLLGEIERRAITDGYRTLMVEAHEGKSLAALLAPGLRRLLYDLDRIASAGHKAKRGLAVLKSFLGGVKFTVGDIAIGLDVEPEVGAADSGDLEADFPNLLEAVGELGPDAHRSGAIAEVLGVKINSLGPVRAKLIEKGMIYSPEHGQMAFTVPLFDAFMRRAIPELPPKRPLKAS